MHFQRPFSDHTLHGCKNNPANAQLYHLLPPLPSLLYHHSFLTPRQSISSSDLWDHIYRNPNTHQQTHLHHHCSKTLPSRSLPPQINQRRVHHISTHSKNHTKDPRKDRSEDRGVGASLLPNSYGLKSPSASCVGMGSVGVCSGPDIPPFACISHNRLEPWPFRDGRFGAVRSDDLCCCSSCLRGWDGGWLVGFWVWDCGEKSRNTAFVMASPDLTQLLSIAQRLSPLSQKRLLTLSVPSSKSKLSPPLKLSWKGTASPTSVRIKHLSISRKSANQSYIFLKTSSLWSANPAI